MRNSAFEERVNHDAPRSFAEVSRHVRSAARANWPWVFAGVSLALLAGLAIWHFYADRQEFTGTILHTPLPPGEASRLLLPVNDVKSMSNLLKSPENLKTVVEREQLEICENTLCDRIEVKNPAGSQLLVASLKWRGPGDGGVVLNRVMEQLVARAGELRKQRIDERIRDFQAALAECEIKIQHCQQELTAFNRKHQLLDLNHELVSAKSEANTKMTELALARRNDINCRAQLVQLDQMIDRLRTGRDGGMDGIDVSRPSPERLQKMIDEEVKVQRAKLLLEVKLRQRERVQQAISAGAGSKADYDNIQSEVVILESQLNDNQKVQELKQEISNFERLSHPLLQQVIAKKIETELQVLTFRNELTALEVEHSRAQRRMEHLLVLQKECSPILWKIELAEGERGRLQGHLNQLHVLNSFSGSEAAIFQPASIVRTPAARLYLAPIAVGGGILLLMTLLLSSLHTSPPETFATKQRKHSDDETLVSYEAPLSHSTTETPILTRTTPETPVFKGANR